MTHSPVVELSRAVAVARVFGPAEGLEIVDTLIDEARAEFERAAALAQNTRERGFLLARRGPLRGRCGAGDADRAE